ncbi:class I SAM-dependent DNA methyltransferase [Streptomyces johnsoniae]|uniref:Class I SAM-dependent methyltransferase n=1 Tax=Streptomyces johnsoniae TaxID=3075532 RepID=A0ABU2S8T3_9ACTN|nr:class I SAM-dependent methyltransferase [Streptomyces sp. DSM 41886]MDT0444515.1 class I SAM-dependent methyltransferase [Streptomyces sp. DSM 41886]
MLDYEVSTYGDKSAADYDMLMGGGEPPEPAVAFLTSLVPTGNALELGVGTGRVAIPLAGDGLSVTGVDSSAAMLAELRRKPGGASVEPLLGDFGDLDAAVGDRMFGLVYSMCSTFYFLRTQEEQVRCFRGVAARLEPGGVFVLELGAPPYRRMHERQYVDAFRVRADEAAFFLSLHDPLAQRVDRQQIVMAEERTRLVPVSYRYVWPSELDLMAELAGLSAVSRGSGWSGGEFAGTGRHVSVYRKEAV